MRGYPVAFTVTEGQKPYPTCSIRQMPTPTDRCRIGVAKGAPVSFIAQTRYEYAPFRRPRTEVDQLGPSVNMDRFTPSHSRVATPMAARRTRTIVLLRSTRYVLSVSVGGTKKTKTGRPQLSHEMFSKTLVRPPESESLNSE